ncbi:MAG: hypothetical protein J7K89_05530 [Candidatus Cloacimonetes bacterium]|nr:hypothetical protein [Candidatus Cloacimonadota bacterium]
MTQLHRIDVLVFIQKTKYRYAAIPLLLVVGGFALDAAHIISWSRWISFSGLLGYIVVAALFHLRRPVVPTPEFPVVLSPVCGIVRSVDDAVITIHKRLLDAADVCSSLAVFSSDRMHVIKHDSVDQGTLIGVIPGAVDVQCTIPREFTIIAQPGQRVLAGESVLAQQHHELDNTPDQ